MLATLAALGAIAVSVIPKGAVGIIDAAALERRARERLLIEAALARGIHALLVRDDPLTESLLQGKPAAWSFADRTLSIAVRAEGDKLDLNASDPGTLAAVLDQVLGPDLGSTARDAALVRRGELSTPEQILPLVERFSSSGARLRDAVTVFGGMVLMPSARNAASAGGAMPSGEGRPIYTVRAELADGSRSRSVIVLIEPETQRYVVLDRADLDGADPVLDQ